MTDESEAGLDFSNLDQYSEEEVAAYNERRREEIAETIESLTQAQQHAVDTLREDAQQTAENATVTLESGEELEVRTRVPPGVEDLLEEMWDAQAAHDVDRSRRLAAAAVAEMVETEGFDSPDVWAVASRDGDAGMQWLMEVTDIILEPAEQDMEDLQGNEQSQTTSGGTQNQMRGSRPGWQRQR